MTLQSTDELERHYGQPDPWGYAHNPDDQRRKSEILALLPQRRWQRVLDIGCGDGFLTFDLPGDAVTGLDISEAAIGWARERQATLAAAEAARFDFRTGSILALQDAVQGAFDLVVVTGVLYPQYIGQAASVVRAALDAVLAPGGVLVSCHIDEWAPPRFAYTMLDTQLYPYRGYMHRLEVYAK